MTLVYLTIAWAFGILLGQWAWQQGVLGCATPGWPFAVTGGSLLLAALFARRRPEVRLALVLGLCAVLGMWRYHAHPFAACPRPGDVAFFNGTETDPVRATVEGVVIGFPDVRDTGIQYRLRVEAITVRGEILRVRGDVLVQAPRFPEYRYGDRLRASGQLETPPVLDDFDYRRYLAQRDIHSLLRRARVERVAEGQGQPFWAFVYGVKARWAALLNRILPEPAAALANGMLLGIESGIPEDVDEAFTATGTTHVIVISGSNIALLSGVIMASLSRLLGRRRAVWPALALIAFYVLLVGADAAALRAGLMGGLYIFAIYLGRQSTAFVSLCASGLAMTLINPLSLWDVGFQLSFLATLGLILFTRPLGASLERLLARILPAAAAGRVSGFLNDGLIVTLAAQMTTLPLIVYVFGRLSVISLVTNFFILPAQPPIMGGGMAALVAGLACEPLGRVLAVIPWLFLTYTTAVVRLTAAVPFASVDTGAVGRVLALIYYGVLIGTLLWREARQRGWTTLPPGKALAWAAGAMAPVWLASTVLAAQPDGRLHVTLLPAADGAGEAALLVTPAGRRAWIWDGRGDGATLAAAARSLLTGQRTVDLALGPGAADLWPGRRGLDPASLAPGTQIRLGDGVALTRLDAGGEPAILVSYGQFRALLPAAIPPAGQAALLATGPPDLRLTVLFAPGPETGAWPTAEFLAAAAPQVILWPEGTTYPPDVAAMLTARGAARVPPDASIEVVTDGARVWVRRLNSGKAR